MVKTVVIIALITSVLGAPSPILHYSNTKGFAMFTDLPFLLVRLAESAVVGGVLFFSVLIIGLLGIAIGRGLKWMTA